MVFRVKSLRELARHVRLPEQLRGRSGVTIPRAPSVPETRLWELVSALYPEAEREKKGLVPGRKFTVDIFLPDHNLCLELDGWEFHGKFKAGFVRDREKDRLLLINGFRTIRFSAGEVLKAPGKVVKIICEVISVIDKERSQQ